jgi:transposase-like protein
MTTEREPGLPLPAATQPTEARPRIRGWTAAEKLAILTEYESYPHGDPRRGALLRRSGAYTSHISKWRKQRQSGALERLAPQQSGRKPLERDPLHDEVERLRKHNALLQERLMKAETVIEIQKKVAQLLGVVMPTTPSADR